MTIFNFFINYFRKNIFWEALIHISKIYGIFRIFVIFLNSEILQKYAVLSHRKRETHLVSSLLFGALPKASASSTRVVGTHFDPIPGCLFWRPVTLDTHTNGGHSKALKTSKGRRVLCKYISRRPHYLGEILL